jgi:hypothetical protein
MPRRKIANWKMIRNVCRRRFAAQTVEELKVRTVELAQSHVEEEVAAFDRKGEAAMVRVLEDVAAVAADVAVGKMHAAAARKEVKTVVMEATMAALRAMHNDEAMVSLEAMAMDAAKVAMHELLDGVLMRQALIETQMYGDDAANEALRVAVMAVVATGTKAWLLLDGDEREVEDDDMEAAVEAERVTMVEAKRVTEAEAAERTTHWADDMDKALAY